MRLANSVEALSALGEADLFTLSPATAICLSSCLRESESTVSRWRCIRKFRPVPAGRWSGCGNEEFRVTW